MTPETTISYPETHTRELAQIQGNLERIRAPEYLGQDSANLREFFEKIAGRIEGRAQRVLARAKSGEFLMSQFDRELGGLSEIEISFIVGGAGAGKTYTDRLLEAWIPKQAGIETLEIAWEQDGIDAGRLSKDPDRRIETYPGIMLPDHELWVAGDFLDEAVWDALVNKRVPSIAVELASSAVIPHFEGNTNKAPSIVIGKERGLRTVYNLIHKGGRFKNLPRDLKIWVNLIGLVGGPVPRRIMTYFRTDINTIDVNGPHALKDAARITEAYGKLAPTSIDELIALQRDGAPYKQILDIEVENNVVATHIKGQSNFRLPKGLEHMRGEHPNFVIHDLMEKEDVRLPFRTSHLDVMFNSMGRPKDGITLSTFVGINDPRLDEVNLDLEAIGAMGDDERRRVLKRVSTL